jgi:hypothetical protein
MVTATIVSFENTDATDAKTQLETLAPASGNFIVSWNGGTKVYVAKIAI